MFTIKSKILLDKPLTDFDRYYLFNFNGTPHFKRNEIKLNEVFNGSCSYYGKYGKEGEFYVRKIYDPYGKYIGYSKDSIDLMYQEIKSMGNEFNGTEPCDCQPSLYCPWKPSEDGTMIISSNDYYLNHFAWLEWLIDNFFEPNDYKLNGYIKIVDNITDKIRKIYINDNILCKKFYTRGIVDIDDITDYLIFFTEKGKISWKLKIRDKKRIYSYVTSINIKDTIKLVITLFVRNENRNMDYISIYLKKENSDIVKHIKNIKGYNIRKLSLIIDRLKIKELSECQEDETVII